MKCNKISYMYDVSLFARVFSGNPESITVRVETIEGDLLGHTELAGLKKDWTKHTAILEATADEINARLVVLVRGTGKLGLDMVSLFPQKTFKNRPNGFNGEFFNVQIK